MRINIAKFGEILSSRPAGREASLVAQAYLQPTTESEIIELDFEGVNVLTPSWADEFITGLKSKYGDRVVCLPSKNLSVIESLKVLQEE